MIDFYTRDVFLSAQKQRRKLIFIYLFILAVYVLLSAVFLTWMFLLPLGSSKKALVVWLHHFLSIIFVATTFIFFGIPFNRVHKYYKVCCNFEKGLKKKDSGIFLRYDDELFSKDGVDCKSLVFEEKDKFKNATFERKVFVFYEQDFPVLKEGQRLEYITNAGFLLQYQIISSEEQ